MGFRLEITYNGKIDKKKRYMFVANHTSYIDPMIMLRVVKQPCVFVGKKELVKIPLFGYLYKRAAIMVDRSSSKSRFGVYGRAEKVLEKGYSVCIFPEKNYLDETILLNPFKQGAFKIAVAHKFPIVPMVFFDCKRKSPWYTTHGFPGKLRIGVYSSISTDGMKEHDIPYLQTKIYDLIDSQLRQDPEQSALNAITVWKRINKIS
jgi:1-acyl-sn-glycerol-3-phosphate acyltransferase